MDVRMTLDGFKEQTPLRHASTVETCHSDWTGITEQLTFCFWADDGLLEQMFHCFISTSPTPIIPPAKPVIIATISCGG
jgi:hypothetical protein